MNRVLRKAEHALAWLGGVLAAFSVTAAEPFVVEVIRPAPLAKPALYDRTVLWVAESFKSARAVIEFKDKEMGVIVGNGASAIDAGLSFFPVKEPIKFKMKIDIRDNRYRMTFSNVITGEGRGEMAIEDVHPDSGYAQKVRALFANLADNLDAYVGKPAKDF